MHYFVAILFFHLTYGAGHIGGTGCDLGGLCGDWCTTSHSMQVEAPMMNPKWVW